MSLPLHDLGSIKVSEQAHSYLKAKAQTLETDVATLVRNMVHEQVLREIYVFRLADSFHEAKGLGKITED
jgi:hypothetical protein